MVIVKSDTPECGRCGIAHSSIQEANAMHAATERVHRWFRSEVNLGLCEVVQGPRKIRKFGDSVSDQKSTRKRPL